jgi:hypothetical protein
MIKFFDSYREIREELEKHWRLCRWQKARKWKWGRQKEDDPAEIGTQEPDRLVRREMAQVQSISDLSFKLFVCVCLNAGGHNGRVALAPADLAGCFRQNQGPIPGRPGRTYQHRCVSGWRLRGSRSVILLAIRETSGGR